MRRFCWRGRGSGPSCWSGGRPWSSAHRRWSASTRRACWTKTPISSSEKAARVRFQTASSPHASTTRCVLLSPGRCWRMARPGILPTSRSRTSAPMRCGMLLCLSGGRSRRWAGRCFSTRRSPACACGTGGLRRCARRRASCPAVRCCSRRGTRPGIHLKCWTARVLLCRQSLFRWAFGPSTCSAALKKAFTTMRRAIRLCPGASTSFPSMWADGAFIPSVCVRAAAWWRPPAKRAAQ